MVVKWIVLCIFLGRLDQTMGMVEGLYCGKENCYDLLGVNRESTKSEISKAYRSLAKLHHPDMQKTREGKVEAEEKFKQIANAYEILKDEESRNDYNYMLDHPEEFYAHYYRYYRRKVAPKIDPRIVIAVTISVISAFQYFTAWQRYDSAIKYLATVPKYRIRAMEIAKSEGMLNKNVKKGKKKDEIREQEEMMLRKIIAEKMDIRGGYAKPSVKSILWIQLLLFPWNILLYIHWYIDWVWRFNIKKEEYSEEEKFYLIRKYMGLSETQFEALEEEEKDSYLDEELWRKEVFNEWKLEKEEERKKMLAENPKYKAYRRYMKNRGPGRLTFDDS